jgi:hypothetical protein
MSKASYAITESIFPHSNETQEFRNSNQEIGQLRLMAFKDKQVRNQASCVRKENHLKRRRYAQATKQHSSQDFYLATIFVINFHHNMEEKTLSSVNSTAYGYPMFENCVLHQKVWSLFLEL